MVAHGQSDGAASPQSGAARLTTLKRRAEFLRTRKGVRWAGATFVLEASRRVDGALAAQARFGFTVTKQVGGAVERNRIRRRLKAAVRGLAHEHAQRDFDYVLIARRPALVCDFSTLTAELVNAFERVHAQPKARQPKRSARS